MRRFALISLLIEIYTFNGLKIRPQRYYIFQMLSSYSVFSKLYIFVYSDKKIIS